MRHTILFTLTAALLLALTCPAYSWWFLYNTIEDNMPVSTDPALYEGNPTALLYPNGSILVQFRKQNLGNCFQIIDRYGEFVFSELQPLVTTYYPYTYHAHTIPDGSGGAFAVWYISDNGANPGTYAQRLDSLGNRLWGDEGLFLYTCNGNSEKGLSTDGMGGFFVADLWDGPLKVQRISGDGQFLWGENGAMVLEYLYAQVYPKITYDGQGGAYVVWSDFRPPYPFPGGALYMQHLDSLGNALWTPNGVLVFDESPWYWEVIPDGEGGFIL